LSDAREPGHLPDRARRFIEIVEREVGVPVRVVGVGAERDDYLLWVS
jgi:adenylosuccinate synthase